jgi:hypothetical protein
MLVLAAQETPHPQAQAKAITAVLQQQQHSMVVAVVVALVALVQLD